MVASAAVLFGSRGISATSFSAVLGASRAPRGSIYYHFPEGKRQLVQEALAWTSEQLRRHLESSPARTPTGVLLHFLAFFRSSAVASHCRSGCPVAAVAISNYAQEPAMAELVRRTFRAWDRALVERLRATGVPSARARELATTALAAVEGALILSRAEGSTRPLDAVGRELRYLVRRAARPDRSRSAT